MIIFYAKGLFTLSVTLSNILKYRGPDQPYEVIDKVFSQATFHYKNLFAGNCCNSHGQH